MQQIDCNPQFGLRELSAPVRKIYFFSSFAIWRESRDTFRCAELRCTMPFCAARINAGSASAIAAVARPRSPAAIASSTLRIAERMRERRDLLMTVRRAAWRAAFFADFVLAMRVDTRDGDRESGAYRVLPRYRQRREGERAIKGRPPASSDAVARAVSYPAIAVARSAAGYPNKGGATRAQCESPWICASSAFIPGTRGLPSNNLRIDTASERAALSSER